MTEVVRYVNTASTAGGDGTTNGTSGSTRAYPDLATWEAAENTDLVSAGDTHICECAGTAADTSVTQIAGWTTSVTNSLTIRGNRSDAAGFNDGAAFSTSHYRIQKGNVSGYVLQIVEHGTIIDGIQFEHAALTGSSRLGLGVGAVDDCIIRNCRFKKVSGGNSNRGAYVFATGANRTSFENCTFEDFTNTGDEALSHNGAELYVYNCTFYNNENALELLSSLNGSEQARIKNCVFANNTNDLVDSSTSTDVVFDYNASDDPASGTGDPRGTNGVDLNDNASSEWDNAFTNRAGGDFTVKDTSSLIYNAGVGNASDSNVPTTDIRGNTRSTDDIGAFAYVAGGPPVTISVAVGALSVGALTATIASSDTVEAALGALSITPAAATVQGTDTIDAALGTLTVTPLAGSIEDASTIEVSAGTLTIGPLAATLASTDTVDVALAGLTVSPLAATIQAVADIDVAAGTLTITPLAAELPQTDTIDIGLGALTVSPLAAEVIAEATIEVAASTLTITPLAGAVTDAGNVDVAVGSVTLGPLTVEIEDWFDLEVATGALALTTLPATIEEPVITIRGNRGELTLFGQTVTLLAEFIGDAEMANTYDRVVIAQKACRLAGVEPVASLDAAEPDAPLEQQVLHENYEVVVEDLLTREYWRFATKQVQLVRSVDVPAGRWSYAYEMPDSTQCLAVQAVTRGGVPIEYDIYNRAVYCEYDEDNSLVMDFTFRAPEKDWSPQFVAAVVDELASLIAISVQERPSAAQAFRQSAEEKLSRAASTDAMSHSARSMPRGALTERRAPFKSRRRR